MTSHSEDTYTKRGWIFFDSKALGMRCAMRNRTDGIEVSTSDGVYYSVLELHRLQQAGLEVTKSIHNVKKAFGIKGKGAEIVEIRGK